MNNPSEHYCKCRDQAVLKSLIELYCGKCGGRLISRESATIVDTINYEETEGDASKIPQGRFDQVAEVLRTSEAEVSRKHQGTDEARRDFLVSILGSVLGAVVGTPVGTLIYDKFLRSSQIDQTAAEYAARELTPEDVQWFDGALRSGKHLGELAQALHITGRHTVGLLADALAAHTDGQSPSRAIELLEELLKYDRPLEVKEYLLLRRSKALGAIGRVAEGLTDLEAIITLPTVVQDSSKQLEYLRQALNHSYIMLSPSELAQPASWVRFSDFLNKALGIFGVAQAPGHELHKSTQTACKYHSRLGPGILIFEAIFNAEQSREDPDECLRALRWQLDLIRLFESQDEVNGWNRYTPLAAQAIRLGHLSFAEQVLTQASSRPQAGKLEKLQGLEWLIHRALWTVLMLHRGSKERAATILGGLFEHRLQDRLWPYYRQLSAYAVQAGIYTGFDESLVDARVGAMNVPAITHSAYFPDWNKSLWGTD
jgi:hypothetical protein